MENGEPANWVSGAEYNETEAEKRLRMMHLSSSDIFFLLQLCWPCSPCKCQWHFFVRLMIRRSRETCRSWWMLSFWREIACNHDCRDNQFGIICSCFLRQFANITSGTWYVGMCFESRRRRVVWIRCLESWSRLCLGLSGKQTNWLEFSVFLLTVLNF